MAKSKTKTAGAVLGESATHLLHRALQIALDFHSEAAGAAGLTQRQYAVLAAAGSGEGLSQSDLVRATGIDRSTLADLVARMTKRGLLERERSATDGRANTVRLSEGGRIALAEGGRPAAEADERLLALLAPKKREAFVKTLSALSAAADGAPAAPKAKRAKADKAEKKKKKKKARKAALVVASA